MLENIDNIPWFRLTHAYGAASDVPGQIRGLGSDDKRTREKALLGLYTNIFHQGARYRAAPFAVPFLYELLTSPDTPDRHEIVHLLVCLVLPVVAPVLLIEIRSMIAETGLDCQ